jgi:hypothetical protein
MGHLLWLLALVVAFVAGLGAGGFFRQAPRPAEPVRGTASRPAITAPPAAHRPGETVPGARANTSIDAPGPRSSVAGLLPLDRVTAAALPEGRAPSGSPASDDPAAPRASHVALASPGAAAPGAVAATAPSAPPTIQSALDRFYKFLDDAAATEGRERWQHVRQVIDDLRAMGDPGTRALMHVLAAGEDTEERRTAARLLGALQPPEALPVLRDVLDREDDLLLRRAAAAALRKLQTPESVPVMERMLASEGEDRIVRLSAAFGLAEAGRARGVNGLAQIFDEAGPDGRGRDLAFRALASLNDARPLPFMRELLTSPAEPTYRLQAIKYVTTQGDRQALSALRVVMQSPSEQPSIRDAATRAYAAISGGR